MKYFIVGYHCSGKQEVIDILEREGFNCGKLFSNIENASPQIYNSYNYILYPTSEVHTIFENNSYIFLKSIECRDNIGSYKYYEGLSFYEFDNNDVFTLSPDQINSIPKNINLSDVCFVWMDNTKQNRINRFNMELRSYNFTERDSIEGEDLDSFIKKIYQGGNVIYFNNEDPARVATIISSCIKHPDLHEDFVNTFN